MDESALQHRLTRIRYRQYLTLTLLCGLCLLTVAEYLGPWMTGLFGAAVGVVAVAVFVVSRRRTRSRFEQS